MTIKEAIEKAIEGGYTRGLLGYNKIIEITCDDVVVENTKLKGGRSFYSLAWIFLDPNSWKALGKTEGWVGTVSDFRYTLTDVEDNDEGYTVAEVWKVKMHQMIDHLIEGGTVEEFINKL